MITRRQLKTVLASVGTIIVVVAAVFLIQHMTETPEPHLLSQGSPPVGLGRGSIVLSLSSAMVTFGAGSPGEPLRVESSFDPDVYTLAQHYEEGDDGHWTWRLDFHENSVLHTSVIGIWLGKKSPRVTVRVPPELPFDLEATMEGGYLVMDFAGLDLSTADVELDRGVLQVAASEPTETPMERLSVRGRTGTVLLDRLGNASPKKLEVDHRFGAAVVDLHGLWRADADVRFETAFTHGRLQIPRDVTIDGLGLPFAFLSEREINPPTLRVGTHTSVGGIRVVY